METKSIITNKFNIIMQTIQYQFINCININGSDWIEGRDLIVMQICLCAYFAKPGNQVI